MIQYSKWLAIPLGTRVKIAQEFGIAKNRSTSVINNVVVDDGYVITEVENAMNVQTMQKFCDSKEKDANVLLDLVVAKIEYVAPVTASIPVSPTPIEISNAKPEKTKIEGKDNKAKIEKILKAVPKRVKRPR